MPIVLLIAAAVAAALAIGAGWLFVRLYRTRHIWGMALLAGLLLGLLSWLAVLIWPVLVGASIGLVILVGAATFGLYRIGPEVLPRALTVATLSLILLLLGWQGLLSFWLNAEVVSPVETLNPAGEAGTALLVYHPGRTGLQRRVSMAFAEGLASNGWRVSITTASSHTPTNLSGYDLLVLSTPTYDWLPARRIRTYLQRLGDTSGQPTVVIVTGLGLTGRSLARMERMVQQANGQLIASFVLRTLGSNETMDGQNDPEAIMRRAGQEIPLPGE